MKKAIVAVSFGTTHVDSIETCIKPVETAFADKYPECGIFRAFSSSMVKGVLNKRGIEVDNIEQALQRVYDAEYDSVVVQPTHLIKGEEYEKLCGMAESFRDKFAELKTGAPLLESDSDIIRVCRFFHGKFCSGDNVLVMMGHGTTHSANSIYAKMNEICAQLCYNDMFIGTVEAKPRLDDALEKLRNSNCKKVTLTPLLLVAGDHAKNDMAGDDNDSWKSIIEANGYKVEVIVKGIGEYCEIRELYVEHLMRAMEG